MMCISLCLLMKWPDAYTWNYKNVGINMTWNVASRSFLANLWPNYRRNDMDHDEEQVWQSILPFLGIITY